MIRHYTSIYPMDLYIGNYNDWNKAINKFVFYYTVSDLKEDFVNTKSSPRLPIEAYAATWVVKNKSDGQFGVLILLNTEIFDIAVDNLTFILDVTSHEASHAVDAIYQFIGETPSTFDEGNEPHAYLTGWITGRIGEFLILHCKKNGKPEEND